MYEQKTQGFAWVLLYENQSVLYTLVSGKTAHLEFILEILLSGSVV